MVLAVAMVAVFIRGAEYRAMSTARTLVSVATSRKVGSCWRGAGRSEVSAAAWMAVPHRMQYRLSGGLAAAHWWQTDGRAAPQLLQKAAPDTVSAWQVGHCMGWERTFCDSGGGHHRSSAMRGHQDCGGWLSLW